MAPPSSSPLRYELLATSSSGARAAKLHTRRGVLETPAFMPVATHAHVRFLTMDDVAESGARFCLSNTYHLLLRPGIGVFEKSAGIHPFMQWPHGVLTGRTACSPRRRWAGCRSTVEEQVARIASR